MMEKNEKYPHKLSKIGQENPFRVPDNYFDTFYARLETKLNSSDESRTAEKEFRIYHYLKPALSVAASLAAILLLLYWPIGVLKQKSFAGADQVYSLDEVYYTMVSNLDEKSFYAVLSESETRNKLTEDEIASYVNTTISDYEIYFESK